MDAKILTKEIKAAFADVPCVDGCVPEVVTYEDAIMDIENIFLVPDEAKKYLLPRIMCVAVTNPGFPSEDHLLARLIEFLDADFFDPEGNNAPLKEAKLNIFSNYSPAQSVAVWNWLTFIKITTS